MRSLGVQEKDTERGHFKKTAVKIQHVKKARASKLAFEISDRDQVETEHIGASYFLESQDFALWRSSRMNYGFGREPALRRK